MSHQRDFERAMKGWAIARIIGTLLPVLLVGYLFVACKISEGQIARRDATLEVLQNDVHKAQVAVAWRMYSLPEHEVRSLIEGDPDRLRRRVRNMCERQIMEVDANWRNQYLDVCIALGRADRALRDAETSFGLEPSEPSTDGF